MGVAATAFNAFNYGYVSPRLRTRFDLDFFGQSLDYSLNYIATQQGEASLRGGSLFVAPTRGNKIARLIPFIYATEQAYIIELTDQAMRFYKDQGQITETPKAISAITKANPGQITIAGHGYSNGDPIFLDGIGGMTQLNGREVTVTVVDANNFTIGVNTTSFSTFTSGGTAAKIVQIATPFLEADLFDIDYTQTANIMYFAHAKYEPRKLTRASHTSWTLATYSRKAEPFGTTKATAQALTAATATNPVKVTYSGADTYANGDIVYIENVVGMTQLNKRNFRVQNVDTTANTFELEGVDGTLYTAYTSGGTVAEFTAFSWPSRVTLYEQRLVFAASDFYPTKMWFSAAGDDKLDDFNTGTAAADALIFTVASDQANRILWLIGAETYLAFGTSGSEYRVTSGSDNAAITPTNISVKPTSFNGVASIRPIRLDSYILYIQRNGRTVRSFEYDALRDGYTSPDRTMLADQVGRSKFKQIAYTAGTPNVIWFARQDGDLMGLTFDPSQQVVAWHGHRTKGKIGSTASIPQAAGDDELWWVAERVINGQTVRYVEVTPPAPIIPVAEDYYTGPDKKDADRSDYLAALWAVQKTIVHADSALVYDGRDLATVGLTMSGVDLASTITVTASAPFFSAGMVGKRIQTPEGGQVEITAYTNSTTVTGFVQYELEATTFAAGTWFYMTKTVNGARHLIGETVACLADGGPIAGLVVDANGTLTLDTDAGYIVIGEPIIAMGKLQSLQGGTQNGPAQTRKRKVDKIAVTVRSTLGTRFGTSLYNTETPAWREAGEVAGRPPHLFDGSIECPIPDEWDEDKNLYFIHDLPVPSNLQFIMVYIDTSE